jgi:RecA-family ATPase/phage/plasmid primase-like uncharacterized protein
MTTMSIAEIEEEFSAAIAEHGFGDHYIPADGEWHSFAFLDNSGGHSSGSAILNIDGDKISGVVQDFRKTDKTVLKWKPDGSSHARTDRSAERERVRQELFKLFVSLPYATKDHPYLIEKHIKNPHPLKLDGEDLVVPIYNAATGEFQAIQRISPSGRKLYPKGATVTGGCAMPSSDALDYLKKMPTLTRDKIVIAEGYATAASIYSATIYRTLAGLDRNNIKVVAKAIRKRFPLSDIIVAADDEDKKEEIDVDLYLDNEEMPGIAGANDAAREVRGRVALPSRKDFNDVFVSDGEAEVQRQIDAAAKPPPLWLTVLRPIDISNWDNVPVPQQEWAVPERIPVEKTTLFSGEGATGKSLIQLQMSVAHVLGRDWLGTTPRQGPALFIDAEDDEKVFHKRVADILRYYGARFEDVKKDLHFVSLAGEDAVLGAYDRRTGRIAPTPLYSRLLEMAGDLRPVMIGIASSADVFAGNEIDRSQVQQFIAMLTKIPRTSGGGLTLISHPSLTGITTNSGLSGSTQWHNSVRARFFLKSTKSKLVSDDDDEEPDTNLREIIFKKNNYGPIRESIGLQYRDGLFLPIDTPLDVATKGERTKNVFIAILKRYNSENRNASANNGPSYAPKMFAEEPERHG